MDRAILNQVVNLARAGKPTNPGQKAEAAFGQVRQVSEVVGALLVVVRVLAVLAVEVGSVAEAGAK